MVGLVHIMFKELTRYVRLVRLLQSARSAPEANFPQRLQKCQNTCNAAQSSKSPKLLGSRGSRSQNPFLEAQIFRKLKTPQNFLTLRILGVEYEDNSSVNTPRLSSHD